MAKAIAQATKTPAETLRVVFDYADDLGEGETIAAIVAVEVVSPPTTPPLVFADGETENGVALPAPVISADQKTVIARVKDGVKYQTYAVRCDVMTSDGQQLEAIGYVKVLDLSACTPG